MAAEREALRAFCEALTALVAASPLSSIGLASGLAGALASVAEDDPDMAASIIVVRRNNNVAVHFTVKEDLLLELLEDEDSLVEDTSDDSSGRPN